ncbi:MAG: glutaredoxin 3 [Gammaproteobacteria bacterium]|nr:glutaredoxin 3 [Gammaproteobacteria bacterium]MBV8306155.1 glutaredoxin 3 [Gammaproteobacteria bacterium]MBV8402584.1 glutaredoxin 3 [Gammaproteobacteria bacterium]
MSAPKLVMYVTDWCPYCSRARSLLASKGVTPLEIDIEAVDGAYEEMRARSGRDTVPQIFIGETHVGGSDDLQALDAEGRLDTLLKKPEP